MKRIAEKLYRYVVNPPVDEELLNTLDEAEVPLPTLWLLGKTGAGKSTIVQKLTGEPGAVIGNGFQPCTRQSDYFDYPADKPILRFLDTRGLGEAGYDPAPDLEALGACSHAVMAVARARDPEQSALADGLGEIRRSSRDIATRQVIVVHTGIDEIADDRDRARAISGNQRAMEAAWGDELTGCEVDFGPAEDGEGLNDTGLDELEALLSERMPELQLWLTRRGERDAERRSFDRLRNEVLWYARTAAAADSLPLVGMVTVPAVQGKMLHSLASRYGVDWDRRTFAEFTAILGGGMALRYGSSLLGRQLGKLVPGYGQLLGTATAVAASYGTTYALGRAACSYLYSRQHGIGDYAGATRARYREALAEGAAVGRRRFMKSLK